jgi:ferredoxin-NADP reductase
MLVPQFKIPFIKKEEQAFGIWAYYFDRTSLHLSSWNFKPGQYLKMRLPHEDPDEKGMSRDFSIASSPLNKSEIVIITKDGPSSFKQSLKGLLPYQEVEFRGPFGSFVLPDNAKGEQVFLAGGIGVTAFMSMIHYWMDEKLRFPLKLFVSCSLPEEFIAKECFESISQQNPQFTYIPVVTKFDNLTDWSGETGRINKELLEKYIPNLANCTYYIVGPQAMTIQLSELLERLNISDNQILLEDFLGY